MNRILLALGMTFILLGVACSSSPVARLDTQQYRLTVTFPSGETAKAIAGIDRTFGATVNDHGASAYAIGGMLLPENGGSIPLILSVSQFKSEPNQTSVSQFTFRADLIPDQPLTLGAGPGTYTATLIRVSPITP